MLHLIQVILVLDFMLILICRRSFIVYFTVYIAMFSLCTLLDSFVLYLTCVWVLSSIIFNNKAMPIKAMPSESIPTWYNDVVWLTSKIPLFMPRGPDWMPWYVERKPSSCLLIELSFHTIIPGSYCFVHTFSRKQICFKQYTAFILYYFVVLHVSFTRFCSVIP